MERAVRCARPRHGRPCAAPNRVSVLRGDGGGGGRGACDITRRQKVVGVRCAGGAGWVVGGGGVAYASVTTRRWWWARPHLPKCQPLRRAARASGLERTGRRTAVCTGTRRRRPPRQCPTATTSALNADAGSRALQPPCAPPRQQHPHPWEAGRGPYARARVPRFGFPPDGTRILGARGAARGAASARIIGARGTAGAVRRPWISPPLDRSVFIAPSRRLRGRAYPRAAVGRGWLSFRIGGRNPPAGAAWRRWPR
jgi:hypothetical protein